MRVKYAILFASFAVAFVAAQSDPRSGYSGPPGSGGGGGVSASGTNSWTASQTFTVNPPTLGSIVFDATTYNNGTDGKWPLQFRDYYVSGASGTDPGDPRAGINHLGQIWTGTNLTLSLHTVGDIDTLDFHPLGCFDTSTASAGTITYAGAYTGMADFYSDVDGPTLKITTPGALGDGSLIAAGTRTPGVNNAVLTFAVGKDGAIYTGSDSSPYISSGILMSPEKHDGLWPLIWSDTSYTPQVGGNFSVLGEAKIAKLGTVTGGAVANVGTAGATTYTYKIVPVTAAAGLEGVGSANITTTTGNATLDSTNYNRITWTRKRGVAYYRVFRTAGGATQGQIGACAGNAAAMQLDDIGIAGGGETVATIDPSGDLTVEGEIFGAPISWTAAGTSITVDDTILNIGGVQGSIVSPVIGFRTRAAGSILGISFTATCSTPTVTTGATGTPRIQIYSGGSALSGCVSDFGSALTNSAGYARSNASASRTFARGTYTFAVDTTLNVALDLNGAFLDSGSITKVVVQVYMCYD